MALAAIKGDRTLAQLSEQFDVHVNQITIWKDQLLEGATEVFEHVRRGAVGYLVQCEGVRTNGRRKAWRSLMAL